MVPVRSVVKVTYQVRENCQSEKTVQHTCVVMQSCVFACVTLQCRSEGLRTGLHSGETSQSNIYMSRTEPHTRYCHNKYESLKSNLLPGLLPRKACLVPELWVLK